MPRKVNDIKRTVGVCLTPALIDTFDLKESAVVVIDVLRATTSMCVAFDKGAATMIPVVKVEEAREYQKQGYLAAAERNGEKIEGFDFGNSPYSYMTDKIKGRDIAITTTNGTRALHAALERNAKEILIGSFANFSVLVEYLQKRGLNVVLLCAGWKDRPNLEDTIFAGAMVKKLRGSFRPNEDTALIAETLYRNANRRKRYYFKNSSHHNRLTHLRIQKDVKYALRRDTHPIIPVFQDGRLYRMDRLKKGDFNPAGIQAEFEKKWAPKPAPKQESPQEVQTPTEASN